ncbi:MAG: small basic protein [Candidatus Omnitrophica bacterium]|nr:small basic protein [Candidatus Omnitrophota bacterium]
MSIHPSLSSAIKGKQQRTVLKRTERIKHLMKKGKWTDASKVYGMPKIKMIRLKVKKEKAAEKPAEAEAVEATAEAKAAPLAEEKTKPKEKSKEKSK